MINLALNILDIVQNSIRAKATQIYIGITESKAADLLEIEINDNGSGMSGDLLAKVTDPFVTTRTTRRIGLGLPLMKYHANLTGGDMVIDSDEGKGTRTRTTFSLSHIDRQPLGDIAGVMIILIAANQEIEFLYRHKTDQGEYRFSSFETMDFLEVDTLNDNELLKGIREMINENLLHIGVADLNDVSADGHLI